MFQGYWQDPQASGAAFDGRWLRTGDLGRVDDDGFLHVTGRKKDMLITAGGQHVVPSVLEDKVREHWLIAECGVAGERRPYPAALITLDEAAFARWKQRHGKPAGAAIGELLAAWRLPPGHRATLGRLACRSPVAPPSPRPGHGGLSR